MQQIEREDAQSGGVVARRIRAVAGHLDVGDVGRLEGVRQQPVKHVADVGQIGRAPLDHRGSALPDPEAPPVATRNEFAWRRRGRGRCGWLRDDWRGRRLRRDHPHLDGADIDTRRCRHLRGRPSRGFHRTVREIRGKPDRPRGRRGAFWFASNLPVRVLCGRDGDLGDRRLRYACGSRQRLRRDGRGGRRHERRRCGRKRLDRWRRALGRWFVGRHPNGRDLGGSGGRSRDGREHGQRRRRRGRRLLRHGGGRSGGARESRRAANDVRRPVRGRTRGVARRMRNGEQHRFAGLDRLRDALEVVAPAHVRPPARVRGGGARRSGAAAPAAARECQPPANDRRARSDPRRRRRSQSPVAVRRSRPG